MQGKTDVEMEQEVLFRNAVIDMRGGSDYIRHVYAKLDAGEFTDDICAKIGCLLPELKAVTVLLDAVCHRISEIAD